MNIIKLKIQLLKDTILLSDLIKYLEKKINKRKKKIFVYKNMYIVISPTLCTKYLHLILRKFLYYNKLSFLKIIKKDNYIICSRNKSQSIIKIKNINYFV